MAAILIVDDEQHIIDVVDYALTKEGFETVIAKDGKTAREAFGPGISLVILDIMLPDVDGMTLLKEFRTHSAVPVIMLTSKAEEIDKILGLELGADDYVTKPFSPRELAARVKAHLRRSEPAGAERETEQRGDFTIDHARVIISFRDRTLTLSKVEFNMLKTFLQNPGRVFTRDNLLDRVWGYHAAVLDRTIDSHVKSIRKKLKAAGAPEILETVHGLGYRCREGYA